jgi:putative membrane-bound dehydrogenase-like protein
VRWLIAWVILLAMPAPWQQGDDDLGPQLRRLPALEPADALASFQIHEGFRLIQVAAEPLVRSPVAASFDSDGRLYVVEMGDYPFAANRPDGRVVILDDTDGDRIYDRRTVFLDDLSWPTGVLCSQGGVFVTTAPDIVFARDTDGDDRADERRVVFTGFGTQNVQALVNSLIWGSDGWIYGASGGNGGDITNPGRPDMPGVSIRGRDFRFRPDGSAFEAVSGGGQFGLGFDDWGHRFTCSNSNHIRQIVFPEEAGRRSPEVAIRAAAADIALEGPAAQVFRISPPEPWRVVRTRQRASDPDFVKRAPPTELVATGFFTSATGVTVYKGSAFPPEYRGHVFVGDVGGNLVHRKRLEPAGSIFQAVRADEGHEFLASRDTWFRPVNFANTPSGTLLVIDMYRETIEHPASIPEPIQRHLDLRSGRERGRLYEVVPDGFVPGTPRAGLSRATADRLVEALNDPDGWRRETAQRLLVERQVRGAAPALRSLTSAPSLPQARALALSTLDALGLLRISDLERASADPDSRVREVAVGLLPRVIEEQGADRLLALSARDPAPPVRLQAALGLRETKGSTRLEALGSLVRTDPEDPWIRPAVLTSAGDQIPKLLVRILRDEGLSGPVRVTWARELSEATGARARDPEIEVVLAAIAERSSAAMESAAVVHGLAQGLERAGKSLDSLLERPGPGGRSLQAIFDAGADRFAVAEPGDPQARASLVELVGAGPRDRAEQLLAPLITSTEPDVVQHAAIRALGRRNSAGISELLIERWPALSPSSRREALEVLLARPDRVRALLTACADGRMPIRELDAARVAQLRSHPDPEIRERAIGLLAARPAPNRALAIEAYRSTLALPADPLRGQDVFTRQCATCHRAGGTGHAVGPDLETVAGRSPDDLLVHILDPNREVAPTGLVYLVAMRDGRMATGLLAAESGASIRLLRADAVSETLARDQIEEIRSSGLSLMPEGLEEQLDRQSMADLLAYLRALGKSPPAPGTLPETRATPTGAAPNPSPRPPNDSP